jgi:uncharacterized delta-60 repeat protein
MRRIHVLALAASLLALLIPSSASAAAERCTARGAKFTAQNDVARVFHVRGRGELKRSWYGCLRGQKPVLLGRDVTRRDDQDTSTELSRVTLGGRSVAWVSSSFSAFGVGEFGRAVHGRSLRPGGRSFTVDVSDAGVDAVAVRDDGAAAWLVADGDYREVNAIGATATEPAPLAYARGIDRASLSIDGDGVHWTQGGVAHSAQPVAPVGTAPPRTGIPGPQTLDPRYGSCGVLDPLPDRSSVGAHSMAVAPDGSVVVAGGGNYADDKRLLITRLRPDGSVDPAFGQGGTVVSPLPGAQGAWVNSVAVQPDGRIVVAGDYIDTKDDRRAYLARYSADGALDQGFGESGFVRDALPGPGAAGIGRVAVMGDGIVAAGVRAEGADPDARVDRFVVSRYRADGTLDPGFGGSGVVTVDTDGEGAHAGVIRVVGDKVIAAGRAGGRFAVVRLNGDGSLDTTFGDGGKNFASPPARADVTDLAVLADGRIVAVGTATGSLGRSLLVLARYSADGRVETSFGSGGFTIDRFAWEPTAVVVRDDGKLIVAGTADYADYYSVSGLLRYNADGTRDTAFGLHGALAIFATFGSQTNQIVAQPDGTVLAAQTASGHFAVARFVVDEPALAAVAGSARVCSAGVATKSLSQLLRRGKTARNGKLRVVFERHQPGDVRVSAVARIGSRSVPLGAATPGSPAAGTDFVEISLSRGARRALRSAKRADIVVTLQGVDGGAATEVTRRLAR